MIVEDLRADFDAHRVGVQTQRKALMMLQGILRRAVLRGLIAANPVSVVDKPRQPRTRRPDPLPPMSVSTASAASSRVEAIVRAMLARRRSLAGSVIADLVLRSVSSPTVKELTNG